MRLEGVRRFEASREAVFDALVDPDLVAGTMPGLESLTVRDADHWTGSVKLSVAPRLKMSFEVKERRRPERARLLAHGKSFGAGIRLETAFDLEAAGTGTDMRYSAEFSLGGVLGRIGEATLRPVAERQVEKLLSAVERRASGPDTSSSR